MMIRISGGIVLREGGDIVENYDRFCLCLVFVFVVVPERGTSDGFIGGAGVLGGWGCSRRWNVRTMLSGLAPNPPKRPQALSPKLRVNQIKKIVTPLRRSRKLQHCLAPTSAY
jgi:hypothetical protein